MNNPFQSYNIEYPKKYSNPVKSFCKTAGQNESEEYAPFPRQVDLWYFCFLYAVNRNLEPSLDKEQSTNITAASILSNDAYRIAHIQLVYLAKTESLVELVNHRAAMDYANQMAAAGMPYVLQLLGDSDDLPINNLNAEIESIKS